MAKKHKKLVTISARISENQDKKLRKHLKEKSISAWVREKIEGIRG